MQLREALVTLQPTAESALQTHQQYTHLGMPAERSDVCSETLCLHKKNCRGVTEVPVKIPCDVEEKRIEKALMLALYKQD